MGSRGVNMQSVPHLKELCLELDFTSANPKSS